MFQRALTPHVILFSGAPDDDTAHRWLLHQLDSLLAPTYITGPLTSPVKGNLGEGITFCIGDTFDFAGMRSAGANLKSCTAAISKPDIDIVWIHFSHDPSEDRLWLQEVKTTGAANLSYADELITDYDKLFDAEPRLTLQARLGGIATDFRFLAHDLDATERILNLAEESLSPGQCTRISLVPTIVHQRPDAEANVKLLAVRTTLISRGWGGNRVTPWSIRFGQLNDRLERLSHGHE